MSDYKRFVSYIYGYEQGEKRESAGFVKVNARGEECKIRVHIKGFYTHGQKPYRVYVFGRSRERLEGWLLGELENRDAALEWNGVTKTDSLMGTGMNLEDSRGLYIEGEGRVFAAEWDDYPVNVEHFVPMKGSARQEMAESASESAAETPALEKTVPEETVLEESVLRENVLEKASQEEAVQAEEVLLEEPAAERIVDPRQNQWNYLTHHFQVMQYRDGEALISSIRLNNRDLARFPREKWELGNNSFLLHGFYQYRHLLLLRRQTRVDVQYLIGVPGVYNEREQMMASMFGFQEFKVMKGPDVKNGSFGYWCRILQ